MECEQLQQGVKFAEQTHMLEITHIPKKFCMKFFNIDDIKVEVTQSSHLCCTVIRVIFINNGGEPNLTICRTCTYRPGCGIEPTSRFVFLIKIKIEYALSDRAL